MLLCQCLDGRYFFADDLEATGDCRGMTAENKWKSFEDRVEKRLKAHRSTNKEKVREGGKKLILQKPFRLAAHVEVLSRSPGRGDVIVVGGLAIAEWEQM